jgi:hypothetical protein
MRNRLGRPFAISAAALDLELLDVELAGAGFASANRSTPRRPS